jgi:hypothetical protein
MEIKISTISHFAPTRMARTKRQTSVNKDVRNKDVATKKNRNRTHDTTWANLFAKLSKRQ